MITRLLAPEAEAGDVALGVALVVTAAGVARRVEEEGVKLADLMGLCNGTICQCRVFNGVIVQITH
jgi:hypothetical protein